MDAERSRETTLPLDIASVGAQPLYLTTLGHDQIVTVRNVGLISCIR